MGQPDAGADQCAVGNADADAGLYDCGESGRPHGGAGQQWKFDGLNLGRRRLLIGCVVVGFQYAFGCDGAVQSDVDQRVADLDRNVHGGVGNGSRNVLDHHHGDEWEPVAFNEREPDGGRGEVELHDFGLAYFAHGDAWIVG